MHHPEACTLKGALAYVPMDDAQNEDFVEMHSARIHSNIKNYTLEYKEQVETGCLSGSRIIQIRGVASPHWNLYENDI